MYDYKVIKEVIEKHGEAKNVNWLTAKVNNLLEHQSTKELYMTYSLIGSKFSAMPICFSEIKNETVAYFKNQNATILQVARIYLLSTLIASDTDFYTTKVANIIQVADTSELETFLKFLIVLPNHQAYKDTAVEAVRTNIATIFDAIALNNPYPGKYFSDQQWNQMYLKAIFMDRDLSLIMDIDARANKDLSRIISDYAHERWAASRSIDPLFWRPVTTYLDEHLLDDMKQLLESKDPIENRAAALCCYFSENNAAVSLLDNYKDLKNRVATKKLTWETLKR